ncbi:MAG: serine hydrolase domain-containing protein [Longibaculum sp.]
MQIIKKETISYFLNLLEKRHIECHALSICQNGHVLLEKAFSPYTLESLHPVYSVTKSFTSMAIGFLEAEGKLNIENSWISYFPEYEEYVADKQFYDVNIKHLLTMSLGQDCEVEVTKDDNWIFTILGKKLAYQPGTVYLYNSHCSHLLSALVTKLSHQKMSDYLKTKLFIPLDIHNYYWQEDLQGNNIGGYGLHISIHDLMKFGKCCLDGGMYEGKQVLPKQWLDKATTIQMKNVDAYPLNRSENRQGYGLHFWMCTHGAYRMSGLHAQLCFIQPENKLVIAMFNNSSGSQAVLDCWFQAVEDQIEMSEQSSFQLPTVKGLIGEDFLNDYLNQKMCAYTNDFQFNWLSFKKNADKIEISICRNNQVFSVVAGYHDWYAQENNFHTFNTFMTYDSLVNEQPPNIENTLFACYGWQTNTTLIVEIRELDHSARTVLKFAFDHFHVVLYYSVTGLYTNVTETKCIFQNTENKMKRN